MSLNDYHGTSANWREQLRRNRQKTKVVIALFIIIYTLLGVLVDIFMIMNTYNNVTIGMALAAIIHGQIFPYAALTMFVITIISLLVAYGLYDKIMLLGTHYHQITPETAHNLQEKQLYNVVEEMKVAAGLKFMPKVYLIEAEYMNAFASGYSEKSAMVAITRGLMEKLNRAELQAVMSHELSHIVHQDIKLTLTVAILSNIMLIVIDMLFYSIIYKRDRKQDNGLFFIIIFLRYLMPFVTLILALFLSRTREFMADAGAMELMRNNEPLAQALLKISQDHEQNSDKYVKAFQNTPHEQLRQAAYIFNVSDIDPVQSLHNLFSTHPSLSERLKALGFIRKK